MQYTGRVELAAMNIVEVTNMRLRILTTTSRWGLKGSESVAVCV